MKDNLEACFKELQNNKASTPAQKVATQGNNHRRPSVGPSEVAHANESTENLTTWTNLCVDRKGAVVQTVDLKDGSKSHRRIGQYNPNIPRVGEPVVKITLKEVETLAVEYHFAEEARKDAEWEFV